MDGDVFHNYFHAHSNQIVTVLLELMDGVYLKTKNAEGLNAKMLFYNIIAIKDVTNFYLAV